MTPEAAAASSTRTKKHKNKGAKKKRKVSKHILQANKDRVSLEKARQTDAIPPVTTATEEEKDTSSKKKTRDKHNQKDVKEPAGYLSNWKNHREQWKFNKNTQSWLIRHMYEADKVAKGSFTILLEYLQGLQGGGAKQRILQEAARRALRYKQCSEEEASSSQKPNSEDSNQKKVQFTDDTKVPEKSTPEEKKKPGSTKKDDDATEEENRWMSLSDHDKRKEYKRARKVLETLQSS